ncbi:hypothetical protein AEAC466_11815 [Asticcacaulis sp. AC466]|uniref:NrsF family protein n=1 Tax=Asticcacaulis sp. AC466 TaxID=1282362 RepID=UPI0003C3EB75|nr:NrsF family protein [Asticcacaulis sp. AC466]ESQ83686.1 hypothetical protein AEAC466_11815 [Asticcacaulis sp. AC466]
MTDSRDDIIDSLADNLKPVRPMRDSLLWAGAAGGLLLAVLYISTFYGFRPEIVNLPKGTLPAHFTPVGKPLLFFGLGVTALWTVSRLTRPEGEMKAIYLLPVLAALGLTLFNMTVELISDGWAASAERLNGGVVVCFTTILCGGMAGLLLLWRFWLRRSASSHPTALAAMSGLATASLMASAYALHCNMDAPVYMVLIYGLAVAIFTGFATLLGRRLLKW